jgi:hypothetical protein
VSRADIALVVGRAFQEAGRRRGRHLSPRGCLFTDLNAVYRRQLSQRVSRGGEVGKKTQRERRVVIERMLNDLWEEGLQLRRLRNFRQKHLVKALETWRARALKPSTLSSYVSHLRAFCLWLGKTHLVRTLDQYVAENPQVVRRRTVTDTDRSARAAGVDIKTLFQRAYALDPRFACQLALVAVFGLRSQEAWLFRPHQAVAGRFLHIAYGTKGGRPRTLSTPISTLQQHIIDWAKTFAATPAESMIPRDCTLPQWRRHYYYLCEKVGLTRRASGATAHSFRHEVLLDLYEWITGVAPPARGGNLVDRDPYADRAARSIVAAHAGHAELHISSAYLGGIRPKRRPRPPEPRTCRKEGTVSPAEPVCTVATSGSTSPSEER